MHVHIAESTFAVLAPGLFLVALVIMELVWNKVTTGRYLFFGPVNEDTRPDP